MTDTGVITDVVEEVHEAAPPSFQEGLGRNAPIVLTDNAKAFLPVSLEDIRSVAEMLSKLPGARAAFKEASAVEALVLQSALWRISPLFVMQGAYQAKEGAPIGYEAKVLHAVILANGPLRRRPRLEYGFTDPTKRTAAHRFAKATFWLIGEEEPIVHVTPSVAQIKVKNSPLWYSDPDVQLGYYAFRAAARLHFPDVLGGAYTREEVMQIRGYTPRIPDFDDDVIQGEVVEAEYDGIQPTDQDVGNFGRWEKKASGEGDSRDPRDMPSNVETAPDDGSRPADLEDLRTWAAEQQRLILAETDPAKSGAMWERTFKDKRWGRLKAYDQEIANAVKSSVFAHAERIKGAASK